MRNIYTLLRWIFYCYAIIWLFWLVKTFIYLKYFMYIFYLLYYLLKYGFYWYCVVFLFRNKRTIAYILIVFLKAPFGVYAIFLKCLFELKWFFKKLKLNIKVFFFNFSLKLIRQNKQKFKIFYIYNMNVFIKTFILFVVFIVYGSIIFVNWLVIKYFYILPYLFKYFLIPSKKYLKRVWVPFFKYFYGWLRAYISHVNIVIYVLTYSELNIKRILKRWLSLRGVVFWFLVIFLVFLDLFCFFSVRFLNVFLKEGKSRQLLRYYDSSDYFLDFLGYFHETIELFNFSLGFYIGEHLEIYLPFLDVYLVEKVFGDWPTMWMWVYYLIKSECKALYKSLKDILLFCWVIFFIRNGIVIRDSLLSHYVIFFLNMPIFSLQVHYEIFKYELSKDLLFYASNYCRRFIYYVLQFPYKPLKIILKFKIIFSYFRLNFIFHLSSCFKRWLRIKVLKR